MTTTGTTRTARTTKHPQFLLRSDGFRSHLLDCRVLNNVDLCVLRWLWFMTCDICWWTISRKNPFQNPGIYKGVEHINCCTFLHVSPPPQKDIPSETNITPKNGWLEYYFPIGFRPIFRCELLVSERVCILYPPPSFISKDTPWSFGKSRRGRV